jgi:hypothetical protein
MMSTCERGAGVKGTSGEDCVGGVCVDDGLMCVY